MMVKLAKALISPNRIWHRFITAPILKKSIRKCGNNVSFGLNIIIAGMENVSIGDYTAIGPNCVFYATRASLTIGKYVMISPNVTIVTGEHRTDILGEYMRFVGDDQKLPENDLPVTIEDDVWIGSNVTIMKGVTIGRGSIIHAGAVITRSVRPYTVYISEKIKVSRFSLEEIREHEAIIGKKYGEE